MLRCRGVVTCGTAGARAPPSSPGGLRGAGSPRPLGALAPPAPHPVNLAYRTINLTCKLNYSFPISESSVGTGAGCFPSGAMVHTEAGPRDISTLQLGERILAADDSGKAIYSEVLTFIDRDPNATKSFIEVTAENGVTITTTRSHLLLLASADGWREVFAADVEIGDVLLTRGQGPVMRPSRVIKTKIVTRKGIYAPLTKSGTIIVDDALASCYAIVNSHSLAHAAMAPLRWMSSWSKSNELSKGVHWYANALYNIGDFVLPSSYKYR
ncbi:unnamed protein product [Pieris macdunnoughi]|uniref:Hint domain-containing protein n=1 Tax=Pieris macdunnoughi TaxID=345717 RepID=A0A821MG84_9NEOP|nr:unnamed protein product [Pieris macdunnoughi]